MTNAAIKKTELEKTEARISGKPQAKKKQIGSKSRRKSRELVLKAIYRGMMNESDLKVVLIDMQDDPDYRKADEVYFKQLLNGVIEHTTALDAQISSLADRKLTELSPIEHAILRVSAYELMFDMSIPYRVVINEGVELAKIYGGTDGYKYINGILDKMAANTRQQEFDQL